MRDRLRYWYWRLWCRAYGLPVIAGAAEDDDDDADDDDDVDETALDEKVKGILKKERKARRDAEKAQRKAEREAREERASLQSQISALEGRLESAGRKSEGDGDGDNAEIEELRKKVSELETQLEEKTGEVESAGTNLKRARLLAELRDPNYAIAPDAVDIVAEQLEVEYGDDGQPTGVKDAVEEYLEKKPSLKRQEDAVTAGVSAGNPDAGRSRGGQMSMADAKKLAQQNPDEFNRKFEAGEIPAGALGG